MRNFGRILFYKRAGTTVFLPLTDTDRSNGPIDRCQVGSGGFHDRVERCLRFSARRSVNSRELVDRLPTLIDTVTRSLVLVRGSELRAAVCADLSPIMIRGLEPNLR